MAKDDESQPISEDTLDEIKKGVMKGKARKFVMIVKGGAIQTFVVFKKGAFASRISAAKKAGFSGNIACGVISGKGPQAVLQLAGNKEVAVTLGLSEGDVCDKEPCKPERLKQFLKETGDLKLQPSFAVVTDLSAVQAVSEQEESEGGEQEADDASSSAPPQRHRAARPARGIRGRRTGSRRRFVAGAP